MFTIEIPCGILGCSSEKRYKTTLLDLQLFISGKKTCHLSSALSLRIESKLFLPTTFEVVFTLEEILFPTCKKR